MTGRGRTATLLELAGNGLRDRIRPKLGPGERIQAALIARAIEVTARRIRLQETHDDRDRDQLALLLDLPDTTSLDDLRAQLVIRIKHGGFAGDEAALRAVLRSITQRRLAVSNPKHHALVV